MKEDLKIADIIVRYVSNKYISDKEFTLINNWINKSRENQMFIEEVKNRFINGEDIYNLYESEFNLEEDWNNFLLLKNKSKNRKLKSILYIAASVFIIISSYYILSYRKVNKSIPKEELVQMETNKNSPVLVLSNGNKVELSNDVKINNIGISKEHKQTVISYKNTEKSRALNGILNYNTIKLPFGTEVKIELSDGSCVWLNGNSSLKYPIHFESVNREVFLTGEAYFKVKKQANSKFTVHTDNISVNVLGTEFNIKSYTNEEFIEATLVSGNINIDNKKTKETINIKPGFQLRINNITGSYEKKKVDILPYTAWKDGKFVFYHQRLGDIVKDLSRWYNVKFIFDEKGLEDIKVFAIIDKYKSIEIVLELLKSSKLISYRIDGNRVYINNFNN